MSDQRTFKWPRYLRSAARLRVAIERNLEDYLFERDHGGRIFYVFDANIIKLFLSPAEVSERVASLGELADDPHLPATAVITAEFLFSRHLSGQHDTPALLAPGHAEDVAAMIDSIERRVADLVHGEGTDDGGQRLGRGGADATHLKRLVNSVSFKDGDIERPMRQLVEGLPKAAQSLFDNSVNEARQVSRIVNEDLLRPLRLHPAATREIMSPDPRIVAIWADRIREEHRAVAHGERQAAFRERIRRDAEALTQTLILNDAARDALVPTRYVFVTTDKAIRLAYARWFWLENADRSSGYLLRDPAQYVPILNAQQMRNRVGKSDLLEHVRTAIDALFEGVRDDLGDTDYKAFLARYADGCINGARVRRPLAWKRALQRLEAINDEGRSEPFDKLNGLWREAGRSAVLLNADLLHRRFQVEFEPVVELLNTYASIKSKVLAHLKTVVLNLGDAHAALIAGGLEGGAPSPPAVGELPVAPKGPSLVPLLARLPSRGTALATRLMDADPDQQRGSARPTIFYEAACAAFRSGRWSLAQGYARRAQVIFRASLHGDRPSLHPDEVEAYTAEAAYVAAAATILRMDDKATYDQVRGANAEAIAYHRRHGDRYGLLRGIVTDSALVLGRLYRGRLQSHMVAWWSGHDPLLAFLRTSDRLVEAVALFPADAFPSPGYVRRDGDATALRAFLWQQVAFASAFERLFLKPVPVFDDIFVGKAIAMMDADAGLHHESHAARMVVAFLKSCLHDGETDHAAPESRREVAKIASCVEASDTIEAALARHLTAWARSEPAG